MMDRASLSLSASRFHCSNTADGGSFFVRGIPNFITYLCVNYRIRDTIERWSTLHL